MSVETIVNYTIGVLSLLLAFVSIYLTIKSNKKKEPVYSIKGNNVISGYSSIYENLTVAYKGEKVENFTVSKVLIYNRGAETITKEDITTRNQLRLIALNNWKILDASILQFNNSSNKLEIDLDRAESSVRISFDYLDQNQGAVIQVIHNGLSADDIKLVGDIMGVQKLTELSPNSFLPIIRIPLDISKLSPRRLLALMFFGLIYMLCGLINWFMLRLDAKITLFFLLAGIVTFLISPISYLIEKFNSIKTTPEGLEKFLA